MSLHKIFVFLSKNMEMIGMGNMKKRKSSTKEIEEVSIKYVMKHLKQKGEKPERGKKGVDIISGEKYIEVKGSMKREPNIRMVSQALKYVEKHNKLKQNSFFIYYVFDMASGNPKLMIFDYDTFEKHKIPETKWIIQPFKIRRETGKPEEIQL